MPAIRTDSLTIGDVAERTGIAAGTIRMWEQRFGFPMPERTPSGYRRYSDEDVETLRRVVAYRQRGLSVPAALERARAAGGASDRPSLYAAVAAAGPETSPRPLRKSTLVALSRAIEDEALARAAAPVIVASFQEERFYRAVEHRYRALARLAEAVVVFADFPRVRRSPGGPVELPIAPDDALGHEWAVVVDAPGYAACLVGWEQPGREPRGGPDDAGRRFEAVWTVDAAVARRAAMSAAAIATRADQEAGDDLARTLYDRPLAVESPAPALTSLTNRTIAYLESAGG